MERINVDVIKNEYPPGTRVKCIFMSDPFHPVASGTEGTVNAVDDAGTIHVAWDSGSSLGLIPGEDSFEIIKKKEKKKDHEETR